MTPKKPNVEKAEKSEVGILHPDVQVAGYRVKPWSFDMFFDMMPVFLRGSEILKEQGITFENLENLGSEKDVKKIIFTLRAVLPILPEIVGTTLGIKTEKVREMEFDRVISIALVILIQNAERIKNFFGLGKTALQTLITS